MCGICWARIECQKFACKMCKNNCVSACSSWQQWIKALLILLYTLFVLIVVPWLIVYTVKDGFTKKDQLLLVGGLFVLTSVPLCIWHILQHMLHFTKPILQKPIIRILWMVPIYSGNAVSFPNAKHHMYFQWHAFEVHKVGLMQQDTIYDNLNNEHIHSPSV